MLLCDVICDLLAALCVFSKSIIRFCSTTNVFVKSPTVCLSDVFLCLDREERLLTL